MNGHTSQPFENENTGQMNPVYITTKQNNTSRANEPAKTVEMTTHI